MGDIRSSQTYIFVTFGSACLYKSMRGTPAHKHAQAGSMDRMLKLTSHTNATLCMQIDMSAMPIPYVKTP